ncbi:Ig-like domain-containing protein [Lacticaseibacillus saniviri]
MRRLISIVFLISFIFALSPKQTVNAAPPTPPFGSPSPSYNWINGGFKSQPRAHYNAVINQDLPLRVVAAPDITFAAAIIGKTATFEWRQSLNKVPWLKVSNNVYQSPVGTAPETDDFIFHPTVVGTYYLQVQVKWSRTLFADVRYQTRLITIDVLPESVATTGLSVDVDHPILFPGFSTTAHATLTPEDATDRITWQVSPADIVTIDPDTGNINSTANRYGKVTITATSGQHKASTTLIVGGVRDQTVQAGQPVTFRAEGIRPIPNTKLTYQWYRLNDSGGRQLIRGATQSTYTFTTNSNPTLASNPDHLRRFQVGLTTTYNGQSDVIYSNPATLTLQAEEEATFELSQVPDFVPAQDLRVADFFRGDQVIPINAQPIILQDTTTGNNQVMLTARLSPFINQTNRHWSNRPTLGFTVANRVVTLPANNQSTRIADIPQGQGLSQTTGQLYHASLNIPQLKKVNAGTYQATLLWEANLVPTN